MLSLSKHTGEGLCARVFDRLRLTLLFVFLQLVMGRYEAISELHRGILRGRSAYVEIASYLAMTEDIITKKHHPKPDGVFYVVPHLSVDRASIKL